MGNEKRVNPLIVILATIFIVIGLSDITIFTEASVDWSIINAIAVK